MFFRGITMKPEDIRKLYREVDAATFSEAAQTTEEIRTDAEQARRFIQTMYALASEDPEFAKLYRLWLENMMSLLLSERIEADDAFALKGGELLIGLMARTSERTPRGKPKHPKSA